MSGFRATADPLTTDDFEVTAAIVLDPLYPHGSTVWGPSPKPREALSRRRPSAASSSPAARVVARRHRASAAAIMSALAGKYVLVLPYERPGRLRHVHAAPL